MKICNMLAGVLVLLMCLSSCAGSTKGVESVAADSVVTEAELLKMEVKPNYTHVVVMNPWKEGTVLSEYVLVPGDKELPKDLPNGTVVRTPISKGLVYSSVHTSVMAELGCGDAVKGVCDANFFTDTLVLARLKAGEIADCGSSMGPSVEKVIALSPDAILLSPYQDGTYGQITKLKIPIIECADYMERTPLGRAEWIKFYGALLGQSDKADSIFEEVKSRYAAVKANVAKLSGKKPTVLTETVIGGVWNVPGGKSYMARLIEDAGGYWPWCDDQNTGSLSLNFDQVLVKAQHADVWLIKSFGVKSYADLKSGYALNDKFDAYQRRNVWICDTQNTHFFDEFPFHPDLLLEEYFNLFHRDAKTECKLRYFAPLPEK